jgi:hypothetical protein
MRIELLSAVALAALGAAACTGERDYAEEETTTQETTVEAETDDQDRFAATEPETAPMTVPPGGTAETIPPETTTGTPPTESAPPLGTETGPTTITEAPATPTTITVAIDEINTKTDLDRIANQAFMQADTDKNGQLSQAEFLALASGVDQFRMEAGEPIGEGDIDTSAEAEVTVEPADQAKVQVVFNDAAEGADALTMEQLRQAFLDRFEQADANNDDQLSEDERQTFANLIVGIENSQ